MQKKKEKEKKRKSLRANIFAIIRRVPPIFGITILYVRACRTTSAQVKERVAPPSALRVELWDRHTFTSFS